MATLRVPSRHLPVWFVCISMCCSLRTMQQGAVIRAGQVMAGLGQSQYIVRPLAVVRVLHASPEMAHAQGTAEDNQVSQIRRRSLLTTYGTRSSSKYCSFHFGGRRQTTHLEYGCKRKSITRPGFAARCPFVCLQGIAVKHFLCLSLRTTTREPVWAPEEDD